MSILPRSRARIGRAGATGVVRGFALCGVAGFLALTGQSPAAAIVAPVTPEPLLVPIPVAPDLQPPQPVTPESTTAPPAPAATPSEAPQPTNPDGVQLWTTLRLSAQDALNAHTSDLSAAQLLATLGQPGALTVNLRVDPAGTAAGQPVLAAAWLKCPGTSWCDSSQAVTIAGMGGAAGQRWSDYTGSTWDRAALSAPGVDAPVPARANALHTVTDATIPPGTVGATTWVAQLWPQLDNADQLPRAGEVLKLRYRLASDGSVATAPVTLGTYAISVPVVNATTVGTIAGDTLTTDASGRLAVSLWRPQQLGATVNDPVTDLAGQYYGLILSDGTSRISCSPARYSEPVGLAVPDDVVWDGPTGENSLSLRDSAPTDLAVATATPIGFTLDVAGCLADAAARGTGLGSDMTATLLAADSPAGSAVTDVLSGPAASSAGVTYRLRLAAG